MAELTGPIDFAAGAARLTASPELLSGFEFSSRSKWRKQTIGQIADTFDAHLLRVHPDKKSSVMKSFSTWKFSDVEIDSDELKSGLAREIST